MLAAVEEARARPFRRPGFWLALLVLADFALSCWLLQRGWRSNPLLWLPQSDAKEYWDWAGRIAGGAWVDDEPFFSAPLYPYFLALVRGLGGGLAAVFVVQGALRSLTAVLLYRLGARRLGGPGFGLAAAAVFLALGEPAHFAHRVLNSSLQLFLLAAFLTAADAAHRRRAPAPLALAGALLGLNVLANPTMLVLLPALPLWLGFRTRAAWRDVGCALAPALLVIAPATLHNWLATRSGPAGPELILVSAQSGITYAHGNSAQAYGHYTPVPGVAVERALQNASAYAVAKAATGKEGWKNVSSHFFRMGLDWNLGHPREALLLHLRKASYLFFGRNYSDVYSLRQELDDPDLPRPVPHPGGGLPTGWLLVPALAGAGFLLRRRGRDALPETLLLLLPMAVVIVFWFSPRYRLPVAVPASLLAPYGLAALARLRPAALGWTLAAACVAAPFAVESALRAQGFDHAAIYRPEHEEHLGQTWLLLDEPARALERFERATALGLNTGSVHEFMGHAKSDLARARNEAGDAAGARELFEQAVGHYAAAVAADPRRFTAWAQRGSTLLFLGRRTEGLADLRRALRVVEEDGNEAAAATLRAAIAAQGG